MSPEKKDEWIKKIVFLIKKQIHKIIGKTSEIDVYFQQGEICLVCENHKHIEKAHFEVMKKLKNLRVTKRQFFRPDQKTMFSYEIRRI